MTSPQDNAISHSVIRARLLDLPDRVRFFNGFDFRSLGCLASFFMIERAIIAAADDATCFELKRKLKCKRYIATAVAATVRSFDLVADRVG
jgi:hypothetical protein